jgi:hypothetical protein
MADEISKYQVDNHAELFQHYSNLLFKARVLILTVIFIGIVYLTYAKKIQIAGIDMDFNVESITCFLFANVISLLFSMETGYIRRLAEVADPFSKLSDCKNEFIFLKNYKPIFHKPFIFLHIRNCLPKLPWLDKRLSGKISNS